MSAEPNAPATEDVDAAGAAGPDTSSPRRFCFVAGTHIATLRGEMPVEQLREGDHIRAKKGSFHTVSCVAVFDYDDLPPEAQAKIGLHPIKRGAVDEGLPRRDTYIAAGQQFELSRRLEIAHAVRMAVRKEGAALRGFRFVVFTCPGLSMIRAEGVWTTLTALEQVFPAEQAAPVGDLEPVAVEGRTGEEVAEPTPSPLEGDAQDPVPPSVEEAAKPSAPLLARGLNPSWDSARRPTRRAMSRFVRLPVSVPAEAGTSEP